MYNVTEITGNNLKNTPPLSYDSFSAQASRQNAVVQFGSPLNQQHRSVHIWLNIRLDPRVSRHDNTGQTLSTKHQVAKLDRSASSLLQTCSIQLKAYGEHIKKIPDRWWKK